MDRRNQRIQDFLLNSPGSTRATCAQLGPKSFQVLVAGDDARNVKLYKISKSEALLNFQGHSSDITAISFSGHEEEVYSGSFGGTVIVWDINSQKPIHSLKGHMAACTSISPYPTGQQVFIATGSADCNLKIWDLRRKSCIQTFKGHKGTINSVGFSPDSRWAASGGVDGSIKIWDLNTSKKLVEFNANESPVVCIKFNPLNLTLVSGHQDRTVRYWDLETFGEIGTAEASPVQRLCFDPNDSRFLYCAANESLKLWDIEETRLLDSIDTPWRGVEDLCVDQNEAILLGVAASQGTLSLWAADLKLLTFGGGARVADEPKLAEVEVKPKKEVVAQRSVKLNTSFVPVSEKPVGIEYQEFMPKVNSEIDVNKIVEEISENHKNFEAALRRRSENISLILKWWESGNMSAALNGLLTMNDLPVLSDVLRNGLTDARNEWITLELCGQVVPLASTLIGSKYESHIRTGISVISTLIGQFRSLISSTLTAPIGLGVDLSREDRIKRCEDCFTALKEVYDSYGLNKNAKRENQTGDLARELKQTLEIFISECSRRN